MKTTVVGLFQKPSQAKTSIEALEIEGVSVKKMSLITSENIDKESFSISDNTKLPEMTIMGAASGGALGIIVGGLAAVGSVATGGIGLLASGPVVAAMAGGGFGASGGGILGAVFGLVVPDSDHQTILDELVKGGVLLCVDCQSADVEKTKLLLESQKAIRVELASEINFINEQ
jgi:predicted phage tail protein